MSTFRYLQALASAIQQTRFTSIELFEEGNTSTATKTFQMYKLALDPEMTSAEARERLSQDSRSGIQSVDSFNRLMQRTINRLENLVFFVDPERFSRDPVVVQQFSAVRSIVVGLYLAQHSIHDGAVFHIRKGLHSRNSIPAAWQGYCLAALRHMVLHVALHGPAYKAKTYHEQLVQTNDAVHLETTLRGQHDLLYAQFYTVGSLTPHTIQQWDELYEACLHALKAFRMPWFLESISRIIVTALQANQRYDELIMHLRRSPLPQREVILQTAVCYMAQNNVQQAADFAMRARELYSQKSRNWFLASDVATKALLLQAKTDIVAKILKETRSFPGALTIGRELTIGRKLTEAYCMSLDNLLHGRGPRRGRPPELVRSILEGIQSDSFARHYFISTRIWLLIESKAQRNQVLYDETIVTLWRFLQRRKQLSDNSRLSVFVNYLYKHRNQPATRAAHRDYLRRLAELPGGVSDWELVRYEILGKVLAESNP